ncbi:hypothetical protein PENTCL1PPCAC_28362, partial [Pristionchus entomophagus]
YMDRSYSGRYDCARFALRVAAVLFTIFIIVCVAVGVTLIITQKPVDLGLSSRGGESSSESFFAPPKTTPLILGSRKKFPTNYRKFGLSDLFSSTPLGKLHYFFAWTPDGSGLVHQNVDGIGETETLSIITTDSSEERKFIDAKQIPSGYNGEKIKFSLSGKYAALSRQVNQGFRHSKDSIYRIARVVNGKLLDFVQVGPTGNGTEILQEFSWNTSPENDSFAFVCSNTLFYQEKPELVGRAKQLSQNGTEDVRYGISDWLYEEDVTSKSTAHWWSPEGKFLSYIKFDDSEVNKVWLKKYFKTQYPEYKPVPYPKAGVANQPRVKLYLWNRETAQRVVISPPEELNNQSYYIFSVSWLRATAEREEKLLTVWSNRKQTVLYFTVCDERDCVMTYEQPFSIGTRRLWATPLDFENLPSSKTGFFAILPVPYSDGNIYNHVAHVKIEKDGLGRVSATHGGPYDVQSITGYDQENDVITYTAMGGGIASSRFYRINRASSKEGAIHCLSCALPNCESTQISASPTGKRAFVLCREPFKDSRLFFMDVANPHNAKRLRGTEESTSSLSFDPPTITHETIRLPSGVDAHVGLMMPPRLDPNQKYPLLLDVYGGPSTYMNILETPWDFLIYLCSSQQMIIAYVDGRGSSNRGWNLKEPVYEALGVYETQDQLDAIKEILKRNDFIDKNAVTTLGWSYGGFLSSHIAALDMGETVKCAVAVAPVADFALYDSAYTERYLGMPAENPKGYNGSTLLNKVARMANVSYLLAHGEADDNVHYQHSALLSQALQQANIHFTQLVYANQDHTLNGIRQHLYQEIIAFIARKCMSS